MTVASLPPPPPRPGARRARAARRRALTADAIVDAALRVVDTEGLDSLTMRRVAEQLGTGGASLYAHVDSKDALIDLVVDRVIGELNPPWPPDAARWQEQVKDCVRDMRAVLAAHGDVARATLARIPVGPNALAASERMVALLRAGGLPDQVVAYAADLLPLYATATAFEESIYAGQGLGEEDMVRYVEELRSYFASLPPDRFPNLVALAGPLTAGGTGDERFEFGLDVIVRGLAAQAPAD